MNEAERDIFRNMLDTYSIRYIVVETKYTRHHIEKLLTSCRDRGSFKWIAENKNEYWEAVEKRKGGEVDTSAIDGQDCFPRFLFLPSSMVNELFTWLHVRILKVTDVKAPKI